MWPSVLTGGQAASATHRHHLREDHHQPQPHPHDHAAEPVPIDDVQPRHGGRFVARWASFQKLRRLPRTLGREPVPIVMLHVPSGAKPGFERLETAVREPIELGVGRIIVDVHRRPVVLGQQLVIGVNRAGMGPHGQPGSPSQIGPVSPAVVDVIRSNAGFFPEREDGHIRPVLSRQRPQLFEQRFPRRPPHHPISLAHRRSPVRE